MRGIKPGLYVYHAINHQLQFIKMETQLSDKFMEACDDQEHIKTSAVTFVWTAVKERMVWSYGERGYRYLLLDAGHICQNLYLSAQVIECGSCAVAHFDDDRLNTILELDGDHEFALYLGTVGKRIH